MTIRVPAGFGLAKGAEHHNLLNLFNPAMAAGQISACSPQTKVDHDGRFFYDGRV
jgi:hypothetical protein